MFFQIFTFGWEDDRIWLIFFKWVETTNYRYILGVAQYPVTFTTRIITCLVWNPYRLPSFATATGRGPLSNVYIDFEALQATQCCHGSKPATMYLGNTNADAWRSVWSNYEPADSHLDSVIFCCCKCNNCFFVGMSRMIIINDTVFQDMRFSEFCLLITWVV